MFNEDLVLRNIFMSTTKKGVITPWLSVNYYSYYGLAGFLKCCDSAFTTKVGNILPNTTFCRCCCCQLSTVVTSILPVCGSVATLYL